MQDKTIKHESQDLVPPALKSQIISTLSLQAIILTWMKS